MTVVQFLPKGQRTWTVNEVTDARAVAVAEIAVTPDYTLTKALNGELRLSTRASIDNFVHLLFPEEEMERARR